MNEELLEKLAALEHEQWQEWSQAVASEVSEEKRASWEENWVPYDQLDDSTKDLDREWAVQVMEIIAPYLKEDAGSEEGEAVEVQTDPAPLEEVEIEELPLDEGAEAQEDIKAQSKKEKELVMKVDANKYPNVARLLGQTLLARVIKK